MKSSRTPLLPPYLVSLGAIKKSPLCLFDVGASGGVDRIWDSFFPNYQAFAFEPDPEECTRLQSENRNPMVQYFPVALDSKPGKREFTLGTIVGGVFQDEQVDEYWQRLSCREASETLTRKGLLMSRVAGNHGETRGKITIQIDTIDRFCSQNGVQKIDFLKTDTDGYDLHVLQGASEMISRGVLGIKAEVFFRNGANCFSQVHELLRESGLELVDLTSWRYSKKQLPGKFLKSFPAQTETGAIFWGDALFLYDPISHPRKDFSPAEFLKLLCLYEIFGLADCAAELICRLGKKYGIEQEETLLNLLVSSIDTKPVSYSRYLENFKHYPETFLRDHLPPKLSERLFSFGKGLAKSLISLWKK